DSIGLPIVLVAVLLSSLFAPLVFLGGFFVVLAGLVLWGIGYATQDTLLKAIIAGMLPEGGRNLAFGLFYTGYGVGWLVGSVTAGLLYEWSISAVIVFSVVIQLTALPVFVLAQRIEPKRGIIANITRWNSRVLALKTTSCCPMPLFVSRGSPQE